MPALTGASDYNKKPILGGGTPASITPKKQTNQWRCITPKQTDKPTEMYNTQTNRQTNGDV